MADRQVPAVYTLGAGDHIRITVFGHEDLSGEFKVDGQGRVSLPLIQVVDAADRTTAELAQIIADRLQPDYLKNPRVSVDMIAFRPFYILGEVRNPGSYPYVEDMTVVTAVALAGGYTYRASRKKMVITRQDDPDKKKHSIDEDAPVMPGDIIEVPERYF
ncbi:MAG: polysaccharide export protein [Gammaproteobacteria bacterium]|nr:polysaccharide export protein [Gammaproteobacteria bacterium]